MNDSLNTLLDPCAVQAVLNTYARTCDERQWGEFDNVFCEEVAVNYGGEFKLQGRAAVVNMIQSMLGGCGPTQHLLGNFDISIEGDTAHSRCYVRAAHAGVGEEEQLFYEVWAQYHDTLVRRPAGWRILQRSMIVNKELGSRAILKPVPSPQS